MAEDFARSQQYAYTATSNLVLEADRESRRNRDEATGEVESLVGKIHYKMGDKVPKQELLNEKKKTTKKQPKKKKQDRNDEKKNLSSSSSRNVFLAEKGASILEESLELEAYGYKPKSEKSMRNYEEILKMITEKLGSQPREILLGAGEEMLYLLKDPQQQKNQQKKLKQVQQLLNEEISEGELHQLMEFSKGIDDFEQEEEDGGEANKKKEEEEEEKKIDKEMGVAVVIDDDEEEEEESDLDEIAASSSSDGEEEMQQGREEMMSRKEEERRRGMQEDEEDEEEELNQRSNAAKASAGGGASAMEEEKKRAKNNVLSVHHLDAYWLQRELSKFYSDAETSAEKAEQVMGIFGKTLSSISACENQLVALLHYDKFDFIKVLLQNRMKVYYVTRFKQAQTPEERLAIEKEMTLDIKNNGLAILKELQMKASADSWMADRMGQKESSSRQEARELQQQQQHHTAAAGSIKRKRHVDDEMQDDDGEDEEVKQEEEEELKVVNMDDLVLTKGAQHMSNKDCVLPEGTWRKEQKGYEEVHVPATKAILSEKEKKINIKKDLPSWTHAAFKGMTYLNRVQSKMFSSSFETDENLLLCAPTGAGKTNVAVLTILRELLKVRDEEGDFHLDQFKVVYVAPMKALVQEIVANFTQRLSGAFPGLVVRELSGDQNLTREQLVETQIIVTTPEKWDIITRKNGDDRAYLQLVKLIIIDEIHLLHDTRGAVLECLVARTRRQQLLHEHNIRLVGLSATLPNYEDVACFLGVETEKGLFHFDGSYRPVPLQQQYIGIQEKKAIKRFHLMNQICYEKVMEQSPNQVLIFVHSRKETSLTATALKDMAMENDQLKKMIVPESASANILTEEAEKCSDDNLTKLLPFGFGIHHAGMKRSDRTLVEDLFAAGHLRVLCSTSTLAWGVNLPAHCVIIKGTQMYNAEKGDWQELSPLDIMQMLGRAGRIQYDTHGEGIIITQHHQLKYYLSLMNQQLPIESQLIAKLPDCLNAEIVLGTISTLAEAFEWFTYTYCYLRMQMNPKDYGLANPSQLKQHAKTLLHSAATILAKHNLIKYDRLTCQLRSTQLGQVASHYYIVYKSMATYNMHLKAQMSDIELFRLFSLSEEFKYVMVRAEEKLELSKLVERVPIPIKEPLVGSAKVNVLLQAYISRLSLDGFALLADMVHIYQSAARILRCFFQIAMVRKWASLAEKTLTLCKMVEKRMWLSHTPLRQFTAHPYSLPESILNRLEAKGKDIPFQRLSDLSAAELGVTVSYPKQGKRIYEAVAAFPKVELSAQVQPITRSLLKIDLIVTPDFQYHPKLHGRSMGFWVLVEDVDAEDLIHVEWFTMKRSVKKKKNSKEEIEDDEEEYYLSFTVTLCDPFPPLYYLKLVSDQWLHVCSVLPISFRDLFLPEKNPPPTSLLDLQPLRLKKNQIANPIQTQVFPHLLKNKQKNVLFCGPPAACGFLFALDLLLTEYEGKEDKVVYISPTASANESLFEHWQSKNKKRTVCVLNDQYTTVDEEYKQFQQHQIVICLPQVFDRLSRRWRQRKPIQQISCVILGEIHRVGSLSTYEIVCSRLRYLSNQLSNSIRLVAVGNPMANAKDVSEWLGVSFPSHCFNFPYTVQPVTVKLQTFQVHHMGSRLLAMAKPVYTALAQTIFTATQQHKKQPHKKLHKLTNKKGLVFVGSTRQAQLTAIDLVTFAAASSFNTFPTCSTTSKFELAKDDESDKNMILKQKSLSYCFEKGVGFLDATMPISWQKMLLELYCRDQLSVLVLAHNMLFSKTVCSCASSLTADLVIVMGVQTYDGQHHMYIDYPLADVHEMLRFSTSQLIVMCHSSKKNFYQTHLLHDALPIESQLEHSLSDHLNAEIINKTIESKQEAVDYLTWTFMYRRLVKNPNYYNLSGVSNSHLSDHLSELIESNINNLEESRCIQVVEETENDEEKLTALNLGMICAYYYIQYTTIELYSCSLTAKTKMKSLIDILASSSEFNNLILRLGEEKQLAEMGRHRVVLSTQHLSRHYADPHVKTHLLLQMHFQRQRQQLSFELNQDLDGILTKSVTLIHAMVDVISSNGWLKPALAAMDLCQMIVQGIWNTDSALLQIPFFNKQVLASLEKEEEEIETPGDILTMEDDKRNSLLSQFDSKQVSRIASFCNHFPDVNLTFQVLEKEELVTNDSVAVEISLDREMEDEADENTGKVDAPRFPSPKMENWWLVIGTKDKKLVSIKRITLKKSQKTKLQFPSPEKAGDYEYDLYVICDSYRGCDLEDTIKFTVHEAESESDEEEKMEED